MDSEQYEIMANAEDSHWWYLGLRDAIQCCLSNSRVSLLPNPAVLDVGCGTGGNLRFLSSLLRPAYLAGFDLSNLATERARRKCPEADIYISDIRHPKLHRDQFDLILISDVIYAVGVSECYAGLETLVATMSPGSSLIMHLPAYDWLTSAHDRAVHTVQRFRVHQVQRLLADLRLQTILISYRMCSLLPMMALRRLPSILNRKHSSERSELEQPNHYVNRLIFNILRVENRLIARKVRLPFGSSVIAIATKRR